MAWILALAGCFFDTKGPGGDGGGSETWGVRGELVRPDGAPAAGVRVALLAKEGEPDTAITDADGRFQLPWPGPGSYLLSAAGDGDALLRGLELAGGDTNRVVADTLRPAAAITGSLSAPPRVTTKVRLSVSYLGYTLRAAEAAAPGAFRVDLLPQGTYDLRVEAPDFAPLEYPGLSVAPPRDLDLGTVALVPADALAASAAWVADSLAVEALLDSNGLGPIPLLKRVRLDQDLRIAELDLSGLGPRLRRLGDDLGRLDALRALTCDTSGLASLSPTLGRLRRLRVLRLRSGALAALRPEVGALDSLVSLDLSDNRLTALPEAIGQLASLAELYLADNQLAALPAGLGQLSALERLRLERNALQALPPESARLGSLVSLDLDRNNLSELPAPAPGQWPRLKILSAKGNALATLPARLAVLPALEVLFADDNRIDTVPAALGDCPALRSLGLARNRLSDLPPRLLASPSLRWLGLDGNRLCPAPQALLDWAGVRPHTADLGAQACGAAEPALRLLYPRGGEAVGVGESLTVAWKVDTARVQSLMVELSLDNGAKWAPLNSSYSLPADHEYGRWRWRVPDSLDVYGTRRATVSPTCLVRVRDYFDPRALSDQGGAAFTIAATPSLRPLHLLSPRAGDSFPVGGPLRVLWQAEGPDTSQVQVELSVNGGPWVNLSGEFPVAAARGEFAWNLPESLVQPSDHAKVPVAGAALRVRVKDYFRPDDLFDTSGAFTALPRP